MQIEVNHFDAKGAIGSQSIELSAEQLSAIVSRATQVANLVRSGQPIDAALLQLDKALVTAQVIAEAPAQEIRVPASKELVTAYQDLCSTATDESGDKVTVSRKALAHVGTALTGAITAGATANWNWKVTASAAGTHPEVDVDRVLARMSKAAALGGAPSAQEAMERYPAEFCSAYEQVLEEETKAQIDARTAAPGATTIVHLDRTLSLVAPQGLNAADVQAAVQQAIAKRAGGDIEGIGCELEACGFSRIEHLTIDVPPPAYDDAEQQGMR